MAQIVEHWPCKHKGLSSNSRPEKKKKKRKTGILNIYPTSQQVRSWHTHHKALARMFIAALFGCHLLPLKIRTLQIKALGSIPSTKTSNMRTS
jgi:hypothetical protein